MKFRLRSGRRASKGDEFILGEPRRGRAYPAADAAAFADDLRRAMQHGRGTATLRTDNPDPFFSPLQLIEQDQEIGETLRAAESAGFEVGIKSDARGHQVVVELVPKSGR